MAASLRAAATTRIPRPSVLRGQGLRRLVHAEDLSKSILALDKEHRGSLVQRMGELLRLEASKFTHAMKEEHRAELIQLKKEQLYEVMALVDADSATSSRDRSLLKYLCTQIEPRPNDPQWYDNQPHGDIDVFFFSLFIYTIGNSYRLIPPTCRRKITGTKKVSKWTALVGILVINALSYCALPSRPEIVEYGGYLVTVESLPLIRRYQHAAERAGKQDGYVGMDKQEEM
uniref:Uncharacterized protein n=1 Tax=Aegilops tauschii TaxID=37682 RepID=M8CEE0_AEGTA